MEAMRVNPVAVAEWLPRGFIGWVERMVGRMLMFMQVRGCGCRKKGEMEVGKGEKEMRVHRHGLREYYGVKQ